MVFKTTLPLNHTSYGLQMIRMYGHHQVTAPDEEHIRGIFTESNPYDYFRHNLVIVTLH